jgi:hypothetical protein
MDIGEPKRVIEVEPEPLPRPLEIPESPAEQPVAPEREREPVPVRRSS